MPEPYFSHLGALKLSKPIGREQQEDELKRRIQDDRRKHVVHLLGKGGIGKSMLLDQVPQLCPPGTVCSRIIDLYVANTNSRVEEAIIQSLGRKYFENYYEKRKEFVKRLEQVGPRRLTELGRELTRTFKEDYAAAAKKQRIVLRFDTVETIQFERAPIERAHGVELPDVELKAWIFDVLPDLENTVIILAGRPEPSEIVQIFKEKFGHSLQTIPLPELNSEHTLAYFDAILKEAKIRARKEPHFKTVITTLKALTPTQRRRIHEITGGHPILLAMYIDFVVIGLSAELSDEALSATAIASDISNLRQEFSERLMQSPSPIPQALRFLGLARKGVDKELWQVYRAGAEDARDWAFLENALKSLSFVKYRPKGKTYLHDYIYDLIDEYPIWTDPAVRLTQLGEIVKYYDSKCAKLGPKRHLPAVRSEIWDLRTEQLYYELQLDQQRGFEKFMEWDEEAIAQSWLGFDMRLRDEVLRGLK